MKRLHCFRVKAVNGQSLAEYGLVLALVAVVAIGSLNALGASLQGVLSGLTAQMGVQSTSSPAVASAGGGTNTPKVSSTSRDSPPVPVTSPPTVPASSPVTSGSPSSTVSTATGGCNGCLEN